MVVPQSGLFIYGCKKMQDCEEPTYKTLFCNYLSSSKPGLPYLKKKKLNTFFLGKRLQCRQIFRYIILPASCLSNTLSLSTALIPAGNNQN